MPTQYAAALAPRPRLLVRTLDRGDGLLGLAPCGPPRPGSRSPLFGPRGGQVTVAWLQGELAAGGTVAHAAAVRRLTATGLQPLPAAALQWRGEPAPPDPALWSLPREADFARWWQDELPALRADGWQVALLPGFAHAPAALEGWHFDLQPLTAPAGLGSWLLSLGVKVGGETLDLVPMLARLIKRDRRWLDADALEAMADDDPIRLQAPGGRLIDAPAGPLKALVRALLDLLTDPQPATTALTLAHWEAQRLAALRRDLDALWALHPSARRDWALQGDEGLALLAGRLRLAGPIGARTTADTPADTPAEAGTVPPISTQPEGLGIQLRPYQLLGLAWLQALRAQALAGILADDMGLGKTAQALAHVWVERQQGRLDRPALVVCPASLTGNWLAEACRITPSLRVLCLQGPRRGIAHALMARHDLVVTSYPLLLRDAMALQRQAWHLVILDEAQLVKNAGSRTASAARRLDARHRLSLTGTPLENHLGELWAQFHFLLPGFLGDARSFQRQWRTPIEKNAETLRARLLAARVRPFILRRRKDQVATELPPMTEQTIRLALDGPQRLLYEGVRLACERSVREVVARRGWRGAQVAVLDALLKLRQVCCDPRLVKGSADAPASAEAAGTRHLPAEGHSAKLDWLRRGLPQLVAEGRRVLVFSQFTEWLNLLKPELDALALPWLALTGEVPTTARSGIVQRFQSGEVPILLASLKAGGTGLNLTAADAVLLLDPWWNPAVEAQAAARAHRIGQTRPVWVARLVAEGSIEERMLALQQRKARLAEAILERPGGAETTLWTEADIDGLLAPLSMDVSNGRQTADG